ncbi:gustatory and odorant receptor 24-like isoform X2 [Ostrinia furnacalis]|uniref:gustatory and odorant receptor 24-like isoform X2 n=1 Tax=Ostrinia furnacalis TaxID=93504 RepID=UPI00103D84AC|nr:gustatory and odorant receptor 24-like isoform X2 [Ostrinia furnacalis]
MSYYHTNNSLFPTTTIPIPNGFAAQMQDKSKTNPVFLDVTPARTPYIKPPSPNAVAPMRNNLINPKLTKDIVYENIKPVFTLLRLMGVLPITRPSPGISEFQIASPSMIYSAVVYFSMVAYVLYLSLHKVQILRTAEGKFEEAVIEYLFTVYLFPMIVVPILWYETRKIAEVLNEWAKFETAYKQLSGRALPINLYKKSLAIAIVIPVLSVTSVIITHITMVHFKPMQLIPYVFLEILTYILGGYWYLLCETLSVCANIVAEDFHQVRTNFQKKLLMVELSWMNTDAQTEVNMFLRATEMNPAQISLGGFFDVNRTLFKSLMATMVTYLVVLLQFQISIPDDSQYQEEEEEQAMNYTDSVTEALTTTTTAMTTILTTIAKKKKKH